MPCRRARNCLKATQPIVHETARENREKRNKPIAELDDNSTTD